MFIYFFLYPFTPKIILSGILGKLQNVRKGEEIKDYLVQPTQFTDGEIEICSTKWDRTVQKWSNELVSGRFWKRNAETRPGWFPLNLSISFFH